MEADLAGRGPASAASSGSDFGVAIAVPFAIAYTGLFLFPLGVRRYDGSFAHWLSLLGVALLGSLAAGAAITTWMVAHDDEGRRKALGVVAVVVSGVLLGGTVAAAGGMRGDPGVNCETQAPLLRRIAQLPKSVIVAGDPVAMNCVPIIARRPVVISRKLYQVADFDYFGVARPRMRAMVDAYYGASVRRLARLRSEFESRRPGRGRPCVP